jgi:hypothetical protein
MTQLFILGTSMVRRYKFLPAWRFPCRSTPNFSNLLLKLLPGLESPSIKSWAYPVFIDFDISVGELDVMCTTTDSQQAFTQLAISESNVKFSLLLSTSKI